MRPPRFSVNVRERDLTLREPSNCVVAVLKGEKYLLHWNRHRVFGKSCPRHGLGFFGLKYMTEKHPIHLPRGNGFGMVGLGAVHTLLADVDLPAAEIGGGWFHGFWFRFSKHIHKLATFNQHPLEIFHTSDDYIPVAN